MKATLILSSLLLLTLVRSQTLFEEKFLLGSHKKDKEDNKKHKNDYTNIMKEETPLYSNNGQYLAKIIQEGDLAVYEIKKEGESHQVLLWSTQLSKKSKGFKRNLFLSNEGVLVLRKPGSTKNLWTSKCIFDESSNYNLIVTDEGRLCVIKDDEEFWCNDYGDDYCE